MSQTQSSAIHLTCDMTSTHFSPQDVIIEEIGLSGSIEDGATVATVDNTNTVTEGNGWKSAAVTSELIESALSSSDESSLKHEMRQIPKVSGSNEMIPVNEELQSKKNFRKNYNRVKTGDQVSNVEDSAAEVRKRFELGCECSESCFRGLNPETVYRHRLNIAELTKEEHDMYLMGVTMACMSDPVSTNKRRERRRARPNYVYSGRKVCLSAFLYLENVTLYQLKRIRKHVMTQGVTARIHGNHGKKPHNVFPLDIYRRATDFLKDFIKQHSVSNTGNGKGPVVLPADITRKSVHNTYKQYVCDLYSPNEKILGYSTFRLFLKDQFPNLRFSKTDGGSAFSNIKGLQTRNFKKVEGCKEIESTSNPRQDFCSRDLSVEVAEIPVILADPLKDGESQSLIVTPLSHFFKGKELSGQTLTLMSCNSVNK